MGVRLELDGQVALVTGASRGIGRETALLLGRSGARVAINYHRSADAAESVAEALGDRAMLAQADVGDADALPAMVEAVIERFGRIDILVNNAAVYELNPFDGHDYESWRRTWQRSIDVNLMGAANLAWLVLPHMRRQRSGRIINVASRASFRGEVVFPDYGASKAAMMNLTKSLTRACAAEGIIATCVTPGFVDTDMARDDLATRGDELVAEVPLGRVATASEVAEVIGFLAATSAESLAGSTIDVNGGSYLR